MGDLFKVLAVCLGGYLIDKALDKDYDIKLEGFGVKVSLSTGGSDDSDDDRKRINGR